MPVGEGASGEEACNAPGVAPSRGRGFKLYAEQGTVPRPPAARRALGCRCLRPPGTFAHGSTRSTSLACRAHIARSPRQDDTARTIVLNRRRVRPQAAGWRRRVAGRARTRGGCGRSETVRKFGMRGGHGHGQEGRQIVGGHRLGRVGQFGDRVGVRKPSGRVRGVHRCH